VIIDLGEDLLSFFSFPLTGQDAMQPNSLSVEVSENPPLFSSRKQNSSRIAAMDIVLLSLRARLIP